MRRRVAVTGVGIASPLGGREATWRRVLASESGVRALDANYSAGVVTDDLSSIASRSRGNSRFVCLALVAAREGVEDAGGLFAPPERRGVAIGSGIGGIEETERRRSPYFVPRLLTNMAAAGVAVEHRIMGPNVAPASACAAGAHAIGDAFRIVERGDADVVIAGGAEAAVHELGLAGFRRARALAKVAKPFDVDRAGFVMGEGAAVLILEDLDAAIARGAKIYAEIGGYGMSGDAYHLTAPLPSGASAARAMTEAARGARVDYVNAHAASTVLGDAAEARAIEAALGPKTLVSSTKGATGHLLGAAGAIEAALTVLAIRDRLAPPTCNLHTPLQADLDFITHGAPRPLPSNKMVAAISNSFGFGGTNAALLFTSSRPATSLGVLM
ncbi:hypothetical protein CTAYLR_001598 [Chrysophaeum taylorii]|uniref:beta-ketoacyl-[acyl-carrier-protein] synthase I n=1 Tax=Chrysophaeum taylorii TaxID=2483200 RepID=A0AAD7UC38_9STRA|nr:hypothetical protein CTAYLR_001598 [Chrysophaeum taylorii]